MIYLDNAATSPVFPEALEVAALYNTELFYNPSSGNYFSQIVQKDLLSARNQIAHILGFDAAEVYFTSGATEANNIAVRGVFKAKNSTVITTEGEHPSVYNTFTALKNSGANVRFVGLNKDGTVDADSLISMIDETVSLVSVIHVSNETGAINDINKLAARVKQKNPRTLFHSDGVQAFLKYSQPLSKFIDLYTVSAHKIGGLKGVGALAARKNTNPNRIMFGGGQESGLRPGTENVPGIMSFAAASIVYPLRYSAAKMNALKTRLIEIMSYLDGIIINSDPKCQPNIVSLSIEGVLAENLSNLLVKDDILIGLGSACSSRVSGNRILSAMGVPERLITGSIRISFPHDLELSALESAGKRMLDYITYLRQE